MTEETKFVRSRDREKDKEQVTITCLNFKDIEISCVTKEVAYQYTLVYPGNRMDIAIRIVKATFQCLNLINQLEMAGYDKDTIPKATINLVTCNSLGLVLFCSILSKIIRYNTPMIDSSYYANNTIQNTTPTNTR